MSGSAERLEVVVGSLNPIKRLAVEDALRRAFPDREIDARGVAVPSGVSDQPMSSDETWRGALERARGAKKRATGADLWVGLEGGIESHSEGLCSFAWACTLAKNGQGQARSGTFFLPPAVEALVKAGIELGEADDRVFGRRDSKCKEGAVGLLTGGLIDRRSLYEHAMVLALIPLLDPWRQAAKQRPEGACSS